MSRRHALLRAIVALGVLVAAARVRAQETVPYRDSTLSIDARVHDLLARMTLEEKFWQLFMIPGDLDDSTHDYSHGVFGLQIDMKPASDPAATDASIHRTAPRSDASAAERSSADRRAADAGRAHAERIDDIQRYFVEHTRLGIPIIPFDEAVHGLVRAGATDFPQAIALAATWDTALVSRVATAIAAETRSRGIRQVLSPVVNIASDVRWGRVEETYGEDPYLASEMAAVFSSAFERAGVIATPKHFVANVGAGGRDSYPIDVDARTLEETYFPPFRAAIDRGHAQSVMSAYNSVDGVPATQNHALLTETLKRAWGFRGFVISDAAATGGATVLHHTEPNTPAATRDALDAGLDVVFQSSWEQYRPYWRAFRDSLIAPAVIDSAVARVLRAKFAIGLFEHPYGDPDRAAAESGNPTHRELARTAAREGIVLLKNDAGLLPLSTRVRRVAVIGADAIEARTGDYSGPGVERVSILDGVRAALPHDTRVTFAPGPGRASPEYVTVPAAALSSSSGDSIVAGLHGEYFDNNRLDGAPRVVRIDPQVSFGWTLNSPARGIPFDWYSVRWTGTITVPKGSPSVTRLGVEGNDGYRLWLDGKLLIDDWRKQSYRTTLRDVVLRPGVRHTLRLEYFESTGNARLKLVWNAGVKDDWRHAIDSAVTIARRAQVAIVAAGVEEGEFEDRAHLSLPGHQEQLIRAVAATGTPVVVVLVGGSAITMRDWIDSVRAVIDAWYPGEQGGNAVADALFGDADPAGRLPITFPMFEGQLPLVYDHKPTGRGDDYVDLTGQPLFPFGFGLSYTTFDYSALSISPDSIAASGSARVSCRVTNTGTRAGDEVVQLYIHDELASVARPVMQLAGFTRIHLAPGESREVTFTLDSTQLALIDQQMHRVVEPGAFRVMVGASSKDIRLRGMLVVQ
ncbi:MAG TPA: glycoside hydrolase family 3 N-terminal domain-containing protein [Gemmatimonadaceae bacterium]|nr:glycoside hydrolase family 3 N-terminal domain-containing protein [Gemmatimonadaceae bacterium]